MPLTDKQLRFIDEYLIDQNATQAYKRAGYTVRSDHAAQVNGSRMLLNAVVRAKIDAGLAAFAKRARISAAESWAEIGIIARSNIRDVLDVTGAEPKLRPACEIPEEAWRAMKSVKVKRYVEGTGDDARTVELMEFALWPKLEANVVNLRALGELKDKVEHSGPGGAAIPLFHTGNVSHDPTLQAEDAAFAESLADSVIDSVAGAGPGADPVTDAGADRAPDG